MTQEWKEPAPGDDVQMPLGAGEGAPAEDYIPPKARVNTSTLALVASFAAALVVLYFLGLQNKPKPASAEDLAHARATDEKIRYWMENKAGQQAVNGLLSDGERLIGVLQKYFNEKMGAVDLAANPFERQERALQPGTDVEIVRSPAGPASPSPEELRKALLLRKVGEEYAGLKLELVMLGSTPAALINKRMVNIGSKFTYLTVTDIQSDRVLLGYEDQTFELKVNGAQLNKP